MELNGYGMFQFKTRFVLRRRDAALNKQNAYEQGEIRFLIDILCWEGDG